MAAHIQFWELKVDYTCGKCGYLNRAAFHGAYWAQVMEGKMVLATGPDVECFSCTQPHRLMGVGMDGPTMEMVDMKFTPNGTTVHRRVEYHTFSDDDAAARKMVRGSG